MRNTETKIWTRLTSKESSCLPSELCYQLRQKNDKSSNKTPCILFWSMKNSDYSLTFMTKPLLYQLVKNLCLSSVPFHYTNSHQSDTAWLWPLLQCHCCQLSYIPHIFTDYDLLVLKMIKCHHAVSDWCEFVPVWFSTVINYNWSIDDWETIPTCQVALYEVIVREYTPHYKM